MVVEAFGALDGRLNVLLVGISGFARLRVDFEIALVVDLGLEVLRPASVATKPGGGGRH
jgi:hypothetical protein